MLFYKILKAKLMKEIFQSVSLRSYNRPNAKRTTFKEKMKRTMHDNEVNSVTTLPDFGDNFDTKEEDDQLEGKEAL